MTKVDIISGFLGAGKTTFIKKLLEEKAFAEEKLALIENEYGEIGIDGAILKSSGIEIKEINSGCICCTIAGDFKQALKEMIKQYQPDRILIEPSGVGKLSDVIQGCQQLVKDKLIKLNFCFTVVDAMKFKMFIKNFAEFYKDQLLYSKVIVLSRTQLMKPGELDTVIGEIKKYNKTAPLVTTEWTKLSGKGIVELAENIDGYDLEKQMSKALRFPVKPNGLGHPIVSVKHMGNEYIQHHHADEVFNVWSRETAKIFDRTRLKDILNQLDHTGGLVLRAKGIVRVSEDEWVQFDFVPGESTIRTASTDYSGRICVIGSEIDAKNLSKLFGLS